MTVHWVFDDSLRFRTMTACPDTTLGARDHLVTGRFPIANLFHYWRCNFWGRSDTVWQHSGIADRPRSYAYAIGTWQDARYWTGWQGNDQGWDCFLNHLPPEVMADAQAGRALLVIDNLNEGFYEPQLYEYLHHCCRQFQLPPKTLCFLSSNLLDPQGYAAWCDSHGIRDRITVLGFPHLLYMQQINLRNSSPITWEDQVAAKRDHAAIKLYNCLNRVRRQHRELMMLKLIADDLNCEGLVSHDQLWYHGWEEHWGVPSDILHRAAQLLPLVVDDADFSNNKAMHINTSIYTNTWFSVITETHAFDEPSNLFISEKLWKPIWALQPFMVWGHRRTLSQLRSWGFETYGCLWDESYDDLPDVQRLEIMLQNLREARFRREKLRWWQHCREICQHNQAHFMSQDWFNTPYHQQFMAAYHGLNS